MYSILFQSASLKLILELSLFIVVGLPSQGQACDYYCLRDAAYDKPRDIHFLCVIGKKDDARTKEIHQRLSKWMEASAKELNLEIIYLAVDDPTVNWKDYGIPSTPPSWPVVVLIGRRTVEHTCFFIDYWEPEPTDEDLAQLLDSPLRKTIREKVGNHVAVVMYIPGTEGNNEQFKKVFDTVNEELKKREPTGLALIEMDRTDKTERILRSFTGIAEEGPAWATAIFGRGKMMQPMEGDQITEMNLQAQIEQLLGECTCLQSPMTMGIDIPVIWNETYENMVIKLREQDDEDQPETVDENPTTQPATINDSPIGQQAVNRTAWTAAILILAVGTMTAVMIWRKKTAA